MFCVGPFPAVENHTFLTPFPGYFKKRCDFQITPFHTPTPFTPFYENFNHYNTTISQSEENKYEEGGKHAPG